MFEIRSGEDVSKVEDQVKMYLEVRSDVMNIRWSEFTNINTLLTRECQVEVPAVASSGCRLFSKTGTQVHIDLRPHPPVRILTRLKRGHDVGGVWSEDATMSPDLQSAIRGATHFIVHLLEVPGDVRYYLSDF